MTMHLDSGPRDDSALCGTAGETTCEINDVDCSTCTATHDALTAEDDS